MSLKRTIQNGVVALTLAGVFTGAALTSPDAASAQTGSPQTQAYCVYTSRTTYRNVRTWFGAPAEAILVRRVKNRYGRWGLVYTPYRTMTACQQAARLYRYPGRSM